MITQLHHFPHCSDGHAAARHDALSGKIRGNTDAFCHEATRKFFDNSPNVQKKGVSADFSTGRG